VEERQGRAKGFLRINVIQSTVNFGRGTVGKLSWLPLQAIQFVVSRVEKIALAVSVEQCFRGSEYPMLL